MDTEKIMSKLTDNLTNGAAAIQLNVPRVVAICTQALTSGNPDDIAAAMESIDRLQRDVNTNWRKYAPYLDVVYGTSDAVALRDQLRHPAATE